MTELNTFPETGSDRPGTGWPAARAAGSAVADASVAAVLERLADIPGLPVAGHAEAYSALHDALLHALNEEDPSAAGDA